MWSLVSNCPLCETYHLLPIYSTDLYSPSRKPYFRSHNRAVSLERSEPREGAGRGAEWRPENPSQLLTAPSSPSYAAAAQSPATDEPPYTSSQTNTCLRDPHFKLPPHRPQSASLKAGCPEGTRSAPHPDTQHPYPSRPCTEP